MQSLAFLTQKGGSGKSTLALHVAVAALEDRTRVLLVDTDPQRSLCAWKEARDAEAPLVLPVAAERIAEVQEAAREDGIELCIIDSAPHADAAASSRDRRDARRASGLGLPGRAPHHHRAPRLRRRVRNGPRRHRV